ncbi:MAG: isochorismatase family protein [Clostridia bacterium]|nr:isochorismatase family protein [Clostridia bacterium]
MKKKTESTKKEENFGWGDYAVMVDMQWDFINKALGSPEAEAILPRVERFLKHFMGRVTYTLDTHDQDYMKKLEGKKLPFPHCIRNTAGWCLPDSLVTLMENKEASMVTKSTFGTMRLEINPGSNSKIYIFGLCTNICVVSNALILRAQYPDHEIICVEDCCAAAGKDSEERKSNHEAALTVMRSCQIDVVELEDLFK